MTHAGDESESSSEPRRAPQDGKAPRERPTDARRGNGKPPPRRGDGRASSDRHRGSDRSSGGQRDGGGNRRNGHASHERRDDKHGYRRDDRQRPPRDGDRRFEKRGGTSRPAREGGRPVDKRDGDRRGPSKGGPRYDKRDGDRRPARDGDRRFEQRDGARRPGRDGDRPFEKRDGDRGPDKRGDRDQRHSGGRTGNKDARGRDDRLWTRDGSPARGDRYASAYEEELTEEQIRQRELRSVRPHHDDPEIPEDVTDQDLHRSARNELKTLSKENAEGVAQHLAMVARLIDDDPDLAHRHAVSASRRAGRIAVVRETLAITAYNTGDFALALRELRTYRRISGSDEQLPLMVDSERGVGRPERALELGRSVDRSTLSPGAQVTLAIAMSGARLDLGQPVLALSELQISQLDPSVAFTWSPALFDAYAEVLEELGRQDEAHVWRTRAEVAATALDEADHVEEGETVVVVEEDVEMPVDISDATDDKDDPVANDAADNEPVNGENDAVGDQEQPNDNNQEDAERAGPTQD